MNRSVFLVGVAVALLGAACDPQEQTGEAAASLPSATIEALDSPAGPGSFSPHLTVAGDDLLMTWLERLEDGDGKRWHRVRFARFAGGEWSEPSTLVEAGNLFANWADFPAVVAAANGDLYAHWLAKTGPDTYAYSIFASRSTDGGSSWQPLGPINDDATQTEHGFVSWVPEGDGVRAFWLDGREMAAGGPMTVRTARVGESVGASELLDPRVCECCSTDAALVGRGASAIAYRDRGDEEIRDIALVRGMANAWSEPRLAQADGWRIDGCPVNGPALAAAGERVALAWFTAAAAAPAVRLAFSDDGAAEFGPPIAVDEQAPLGRVDVAMASDGAWVSWLASAGEEAEVRLRHASAAGELSEPIVVARTSAARASGFPRLAAVGDRLVAAWTEIGDDSPSQVRLAEIRP